MLSIDLTSNHRSWVLYENRPLSLGNHYLAVELRASRGPSPSSDFT